MEGEILGKNVARKVISIISKPGHNIKGRGQYLLSGKGIINVKLLIVRGVVFLSGQVVSYLILTPLSIFHLEVKLLK